MAVYRFNFEVKLRPAVDWVMFWPVLLWRWLTRGYSYRRIAVGRGKYALVDQEDFEKLSLYKWHIVAGNGRTCYAVRTVRKDGKRCRCAMHRVVIDAPEGLFVDHINHNGLDNRKANLRLVTAKQNSWNTQLGKGQGTSKYKGVHYDKDKGLWRACIYIEGKLKHLGRFESEEEAAKAYDAAAEKYRGEYAYLNFGGSERT